MRTIGALVRALGLLVSIMPVSFLLRVLSGGRLRGFTRPVGGEPHSAGLACYCGHVPLVAKRTVKQLPAGYNLR